jgi:hypothetical protein
MKSTYFITFHKAISKSLWITVDMMECKTTEDCQRAIEQEILNQGVNYNLYPIASISLIHIHTS